MERIHMVSSDCGGSSGMSIDNACQKNEKHKCNREFKDQKIDTYINVRQ